MRVYPRVLTLLLPLLVHQAIAAGEIEFWEDDNCRGDRINVYSDATRVDGRPAKNDEIRSVKLNNVAAGTIIELWDDSKTRDKDDWVRLTVTRTGTYRVNNIERNPGLAGLTFERPFLNREKRENKGNLAGKVSHIVIRPHGPAARVYKHIDVMYSWKSKNGQAHEFNVSDSNYRLWKPHLTPAGAGVMATFKVDHIRGSAKDDHASVTLEFDERGVLLEEQIKIQIQGKSPIISILDSRKELAQQFAAASNEPKTKALALVAAAAVGMQTKVLEAIEEAGERGGRDLFEGVTDGQVNAVATVMAKALIQD